MADPYAAFSSADEAPVKDDPYAVFSSPTEMAPKRAPAATGWSAVGQTVGDLLHSGPVDHDPNALEQGIMNVAGHPLTRSVVANYKSAVMNGVAAEPVRAAMEGVGYGRQRGETDAQFHQRYNNAIIQSRQQAAQEMANSRIGDPSGHTDPITGRPMQPTIGDRAARLGQQVINTGAGIVANPQYFLLPGMGIGNTIATRIAAAGAGNAVVGGVSDAAAQLMDKAEGVQKDFDVQRNLESTITAGLFGAALHGTVEVAPFVKGLFATRGVDTKPSANPGASKISPQTTDHVAMNQADGTQYRQLLQTGSVDDIKGFFKGRNGPQPSWTEVNQWVEHRDGPQPVSMNGKPGAPNPEMQPDFDYEAKMNAHADENYNIQNNQAVQDHINNQMAGWKNAPQVEVVPHPEHITDPEIRAQALKDDPKGDALGFLGPDGKIRIFSGRITDPDTASAVLFHEGLGHYGLDQKFGTKLDSTIASLLDRNVSKFAQDVAKWQKKNPKAYGGDRIRAAEEVLAEMSQNGRIKPTLQNAVTSAVKQFGRKMGLKIAYSDAEVNHVLAMSHDAVINGKPSASANGFRGAKQNPNKNMFIGQKAKGFHPDDQTAFTPSDGQVRNEISDRHARLHEEIPEGHTSLDNVIDHPELFDRYPELKKLQVYHGDLKDEGLEGHVGAYDPETQQILLHNGDMQGHSKTSVVLHEIQHAIQDLEGQLPEHGSAELHDSAAREMPVEKEAMAVEERRDLTHMARVERGPPKFVRKNAMGETQTEDRHLSDVERLKADPRFWSDPEFRANVIEMARSQQPIDRSSRQSDLPQSSGFKSEAEARAAQNKYMYAGKKSKTFPGEGLSFTGTDGKPRYEISDNKAKFTSNWENLRSGQALDFKGENPSYKLKDLLSHPELFKAYPELRNVVVTKNPVFMDIWGSHQGSFDPKSGKINITPQATNAKSTVLHEIQHWIQAKEDWSFGGNSNSVRLDNKDALERLKHFYERKLYSDPKSRAVNDRLNLTEDLLNNSQEITDTYAKRDTLIKQRDEIDGKIEEIRQRHTDEYQKLMDKYRAKQDADQARIDAIRAEREALIKAGDYDGAKALHARIMSHYDFIAKYDKGYPSRDYDAEKAEIEAARTERMDFNQEIDDLGTEINGIKGKYSDLTHDIYELIAGEREARDVQHRERLTPAERKTTVPYSHEGILDNEAIHVDANGPDDVASSNKFITRQQLDASSPDYVADDLERVYHALDEGYTPTVRTWEEDRQAALKAGFSPAQIKALKTTNPGELSTRLYRIQSAANLAHMKLADLHEKLDTPEWSEKDQADYIKAIADFNYLAVRVKGERAEIARAQNVAKAAASYSKGTMEQMAELLEQEGSGLGGLAFDPTSFFKFARQMKQVMGPKGPNGGPPMGNPNGVNALMQGVNKPYWEQYLTSFHYNAMLSGLSTHVKAPLDMMTGIAHSIIDHTLSMPIGKIANVIEGLTGQTVKPGIKPTEVAARLFGITRAVFDHEVHLKTLEALKTGEGSAVLPNKGNIPTNPAHTYLGTANPRLGILSKPTDLIVAQDTFFRSVSVSESLYGLGVREAEAQLKASGQPYNQSDVFTLGGTIAHNPTPSMIKEARAVAEKALLLNPNRLTSWIDKVKNLRPNATAAERLGSFLANNLAPFIRVAANSLMTRVIERSPLQLLSKGTRETIMKGGPESHLAIARIVYGTVKLGLLWGTAALATDKLTGEGPDNPNKRKELQAAGWRPNAVHENGGYNTGGTLAMSLNPFDLHNSTAQMVASMRQAYDKGANEGQVGAGLMLALGSFLHTFESETWVDSMAPAVAAASADGSTAYKVNQFAAEEAKSWVPNALGQIARMTNPNRVDARAETDELNPTNIIGASLNSMQAAIPGLNSQLPTQYSVYGDPIPTGQNIAGVHTVIPFLEGNNVKETTDPTEIELNRLARLTKAAVITPVQRSFHVSEDNMDAYTQSGRRDLKIDENGNVKLNSRQFQEYQRMAGRYIVEDVKQEMNSPEWQTLSDKEKIERVRSIQTDQKANAREALFQ